MSEPQLKQIHIMAAIGHVCVQWALLETTLLAILNVFENLPTDEGAIVFGGLDMKQRANMAIMLADHHKATPFIREELRTIRKALDKGLLDRRNQAVHGAHKESNTPDAIDLTMFRWPKEKRTQAKTPFDIAKLAEDIYAEQRRALEIFKQIGVWKFGDHPEENRSNDLGGPVSAPRLKLTQRIHASLKHLWRNLNV